MPVHCAANNCKSRGIKDSGCSFHGFPLRNEELLKKWVKAIRRENFTPTKYSKLCSKHFTPDSYRIRPLANIPLLRETAVPTVFNFPKHLRKKQATRRKPPANESTEPVPETCNPKETAVTALEVSENADRILCLAHNCYNSQHSCPKTTFFRFPRAKIMCQLWLNMCGHTDLDIAMALHKNAVLCSEHFEDTQFSSGEKNKLIPKAVPWIFNGEVKEIPSRFRRYFKDDPSYVFDGVRPAAKETDTTAACSVAECPDSFPKDTTHASECSDILVDSDCENHFDDQCIRKYSIGENREAGQMTTWTCPCCCNRTFPSRHELGAHVAELSHLLRCPSCNSSFSSLTSLATHLSGTCVVEQDLPNCKDESKDDTDQCVGTTDDTDSLSDDNAAVVGVLPKEVAIVDVTETQPGPPDKLQDPTTSLTCADCNKAFNRRKSLLQHRKRNHTVNVRCPTCNEGFASDAKLRKHLPEHYEWCRTCGERLPSGDALRNHESSVHSLVCEICGVACKTPAGKKNHMRKSHLSTKYKCETCDAAFGNKVAFEMHVAEHTGRNPYQCSYCSKIFSSSANLDRHKLSHTQDSPHVCSYCGKQMQDGFVLREHEAVHRQEYLYYCDKCGKGFYAKTAFNVHMKRTDCRLKRVRRRRP